MKGESSVIREAICPKCGKIYHEPPAISRLEGVGSICPDCGVREALASIGCDPDAQEHILDLIHEARRREHEEHS